MPCGNPGTSWQSLPLRASIDYGWLAGMKKRINRRKFVASTAIGAVAGR
jgi:hypothetical protein